MPIHIVISDPQNPEFSTKVVVESCLAMGSTQVVAGRRKSGLTDLVTNTVPGANGIVAAAAQKRLRSVQGKHETRDFPPEPRSTICPLTLR